MTVRHPAALDHGKGTTQSAACTGLTRIITAHPAEAARW
jgi:hypothetical protein